MTDNRSQSSKLLNKLDQMRDKINKIMTFTARAMHILYAVLLSSTFEKVT